MIRNEKVLGVDLNTLALDQQKKLFSPTKEGKFGFLKLNVFGLPFP